MTVSNHLSQGLKVASSQAPLFNLNQPKERQFYLPGTECPVKYQVSLASLTSFRVGGPAEWYVAPRQLSELQACFEWAMSSDLPITLLGAGSNLLVSDRGLPGLVICTRHLRYTHFDPETGQVTAAAGEPLVRLAWQAAERGWQGMEWAVGIPGTVGGAAVMNAGAHNSCTADILARARVLCPDGSIQILTSQDLRYSYRSSILQGENRLVTQVTFQLQPGADPARVMAATTEHLRRRHSTQPYNKPSCGSVFRNPTPHAAAWLIEQTGLKGHRIGGATVAERHANFILNCGGATANDIFQLIRYVQSKVEQHWSLCLEPEVKILGEFQPV
ncbi:UDP-N-acetylmuramate dehydrogenase [Argonema antarcticum]|uniref:UDP-N-acetylmuramate dehydrogenase n=1 Tax=Argonema antarcticum TaxID=2942763 RepID=UPI0020117C49|nr:UDP-N-acetylmuramate dehydrogenase [Argonema antarcticum]MCL1473128.1 UDP-N-acetylmuramate dehydrogenase [Argonema antarcticum A004/B2]